MENKFSAALSRGRKSWCVIFKHPLLSNSEGKPKRVRYGLGTSVQSEAEKIVSDLNVILGNRDLWTPGSRSVASQTLLLNKVAVDCFYDEIQAKIVDPWLKRDEVLPLKTAEDGFSVVLVTGPTGAGKTTIIRQFLGTDPEQERFPSTSPSRTTIFDTELICEAGDFQAVVSFLSQGKTRSYVEECVEAAIMKAAEGFERDVVLRSLLIHNEERFRLNYILGSPAKATVTSSEQDDDEDIDDLPSSHSEDSNTSSEISEVERAENAAKLARWSTLCSDLAAGITAELESELGESSTDLSDKHRDAFLQLVEGKLLDNDEVQALVDDLMEEVESRFNFVDESALERDKTGWPVRWCLRTVDRDFFLEAVRRFSGNSASLFGRLLTPLVEGLRVKGPFIPAFSSTPDEIPPLVLLDGEGIGHIRSTSAQVPTSVTRRYDLAHAILLVDTADRPMQASAQALLRSVTASGHERKLAIAFTHFDQMKGVNFASASDKRNHVLDSVEQAIQGVDEALDSQSGAGRRLRKHLQDHVFFVGWIDRNLTEKKAGTIKSLNDLLGFLKQASRSELPSDAVPGYDLAHLVLGLRTATDLYQKHWNARLGLSHQEGVQSEHWTRVRALSRRFANQDDDKYDNMHPVAHLLDLLKAKLSVFVASPRSWEPSTATAEAKDIAIESVRRAFSAHLERFIATRFCEDHLAEWRLAFARRGTGSGRERARDLRAINEDVAPVPGETPAPISTKLLDDIRDLFRSAALAGGAKIVAG